MAVTPRPFGLAALCAALALAPLSGSARPMSDILASGELRLCVAQGPLPVGAEQPTGCEGYCGYEGIVGDVGRVFAKDRGLEAKFWVTSWAHLFDNEDGVTIKEASYDVGTLKAEQCDMIAAPLSPLPWRMTKIDAHCFMPSRNFILVRKDRVDEFQDLDDLAGKTVAVEADMAFHNWVEQQNAGEWKDNPAKPIFMPYKDAIASVDRGEADFTVAAVAHALYTTRHVLKNSVAAFAAGPIYNGCWGYAKGDDDMHSWIKSFWDKQLVDEQSQLNDLWHQYYGLSFLEFVRLIGAIE